jgi:cyclopropane fatty-acyl-phospholipid synthase-like methyltransferase
MGPEEDAMSIVSESGPHQAREAKKYWAACADSHLASADYYEKQKALLLHLAPHLFAPTDRVADFGCGSGFFTLELAPFCGAITGYDLSPHLVEEARRTAAERGIRNAAFHVLDIEAGLPDEAVDVIACMGVFSTLLAEGVFEQTLARFAALLPRGGRLLLRESVAQRADHLVCHPSGYTGRYRLLSDYLGAVTRAGFVEAFRAQNFYLGAQDIANYTWVFGRT